MMPLVNNINCKAIFQEGYSWEQYLQHSKRNVARMQHLYNVLPIDNTFISLLQQNKISYVLVIAEDWCPDCVQNVTLLAKQIHAVPSIQLSIFFRDENPELMEQYLTNGKKVIPLFLFLDDNFQEVARWAGPSQKAKNWLNREIIKDRNVSEISAEELKQIDAVYDKKFEEELYITTLDEIAFLL